MFPILIVLWLPLKHAENRLSILKMKCFEKKKACMHTYIFHMLSYKTYCGVLFVDKVFSSIVEYLLLLLGKLRSG